MKMKLLYFVLSAFIICQVLQSCSNDEYREDNPEETGNGNGDNNTEIEKISVISSVKTANIFDEVEIYISHWPLQVDFDSIIWNIGDFSHYVKNKNHGLLSTGETFIHPGIHNVSIIVYKEDKPILGDSLKIEINNKKDFLGINWNEVTGTPSRPLFSHRANIQHYVLNASYVNENNPYIRIQFITDFPNIDDNQTEYVALNSYSRSFFVDYITGLYGKPQYIFDGEDISESTLKDTYLNQFNNNLLISPIGYYPLAIWTLPKTKIALIGYTSRKMLGYNIDYFELIAEPQEN